MKSKSEAKYDFGDEVIVWINSSHGAQKAVIESINQSNGFIYGLKYTNHVKSQSESNYALEKNILPFSGEFAEAYNDMLKAKKELDSANSKILKLFPKHKK